MPAASCWLRDSTTTKRGNITCIFIYSPLNVDFSTLGFHHGSTSGPLQIGIVC